MNPLLSIRSVSKHLGASRTPAKPFKHTDIIDVVQELLNE